MTTVEKDVLHFDGSFLDKIPGGWMSWGWTITWRAGEACQGQGHLRAAPGATSVVAEYRGLIAGLEAYLERDGVGPLRLVGDSQRVLHQLAGRIQIHEPDLRRLCDEALVLIGWISGRVTARWVPRAQNQVADQLARGAMTARASFLTKR